jgi:5-methylcytosine-specific restriction endonuclease McrA
MKRSSITDLPEVRAATAMTQTAELRRLVRLAAAYNSKARRLGVRGAVTATELLWLESIAWGSACHYCGIELVIGQGSFDHVVPFDRGGLNTIMNIVRCCLTCQREKFTKSPAQLAEHRDRMVTCARPGCGRTYQPRWAEWEAGRARLCSRRCSALLRWQTA